VAILQGLRVILDVIASYVSLYILDWGLVGWGSVQYRQLSRGSGSPNMHPPAPPEEGRHKIQVVAPLLPAWLLRALEEAGEAPGGGGGRTRGGPWEHEGASAPSLRGGRGGGGGGRGMGREGGGREGLAGRKLQRKLPLQLRRRRRGGASRWRLRQRRPGVNAVLNESMWKFVWMG